MEQREGENPGFVQKRYFARSTSTKEWYPRDRPTKIVTIKMKDPLLSFGRPINAHTPALVPYASGFRELR